MADAGRVHQQLRERARSCASRRRSPASASRSRSTEQTAARAASRRSRRARSPPVRPRSRGRMSSSNLAVGSTGALSTGTSTGSPITFTGLASGLDTSSIVAALMAVDREPVAHLTAEQSKLAAQQTTLGSIQSSLQKLSFAASEFALPSLFETLADGRPRANRCASPRSRPPAPASAAMRWKSRSSPTRRSARSRSRPRRRPKRSRSTATNSRSKRATTREGAGEQDQRVKRLDGLRGRARKRDDRAVQPSHRQHRRRIHQSQQPGRHADRSRRRRRRKARTRNSRSTASPGPRARTASRRRSPASR